MGLDHIPLNIRQAEIPLGVAQRLTRVGDSVEPVALVGFMPVVQEIIVKQCAPDQRPGIRRNMTPPGQLHAHDRHQNGMIVNAAGSVLEKPLLQGHSMGSQNISSEALHNVFGSFLSMLRLSASHCRNPGGPSARPVTVLFLWAL